MNLGTIAGCALLAGGLALFLSSPGGSAPERATDVPFGQSPWLSEAFAESEALRARYLGDGPARFTTVEPGRIYVDGAELDSPTLAAARPLRAFGRAGALLPGGVAVRTAPGAAVTFYAPDRGAFANGRASITVPADEAGLAETSFTFGPMASYHRVIAHSPARRGWIVFELEALSDDAWRRAPSALRVASGG